MKKFKFLANILLISMLLSIFALPTAFALEDPAPGSNAVMLLDVASGAAVYAKNPDAKVAPASLTKIMTVLLAVESIERGETALTDMVTASPNVAADLEEDSSTSKIVPGEIFTLEQLLYCAMLASANDACNAIAEHISGNVPAFVLLMNARAAELGCVGTSFANPNGLPAPTHYTTAKDFSLISLEAISHPLFMEICNTKTATIPATNKSELRKLSNTNGLINKDSVPYPGYAYEFAAGVKTGHTDEAGYCLVSTAKKDGVSLLCVVMGGKAVSKGGTSMEFGSFTDSIKLYNWAFNNFSYRDILKSTELVAEIPVSMGSDADVVTVHPQAAIKALLPNDEDLGTYKQNVKIFSEDSGEKLIAPVGAGTVLGEITVERDGVIYGTTQLVASSSVDLSYSSFIKAQVLKTLKNPFVIIFILVVLALFALYIFTVVRYRRARKAQRQPQIPDVPKQNLPPKRQAAKVPAMAAAPAKPAELSFFTPDEEDEAPAESYEPEPEIQATQTDESKAEHDYFAEFFGKK
ncbi:MAG: D-alanyl-D-alanine carboxypeptidase family protein [Oscillospiraceae bacterium]